MRRPSPRVMIVIGVVVVALVAAAAVPVVQKLRQGQDADRLQQAVESFATAWRTGRLDAQPYQGQTGAEVARQAAAVTAGLTAAKGLPAGVDVLRVDGPSGGSGSGRLRVRWDLGQHRGWQYDTTVPLVESGGRWQVRWSPSVLQPRLTAGQLLTTSRTTAGRGQILGARAEVLVGDQSVVTVGIQPGRAPDRRAAAAAVAAVVNLDPTALTQRVLAASPTAFVDVITLRRAAYDALRDRLQPIPGAVFQASTMPLAGSAQFARALLGTVGPATKDIIDASGGRVLVGDLAGLSGIERSYDSRLAGTAGLTVRAVPAAGQRAGAAAPPSTELFSVPAVAGRSVSLSLDSTVQHAAQAALTAATKPAGLVAIRASTGEVLAVANGGPNASDYDRALIGRYPPGSTFKVATAFALLQAGFTPTTPVSCPPTVTVDGRTFKNAEGEVLGTVPFRTDFAQSCNTAFVGSAGRITATQLHDAATALGYGAPDTLGVTAFTGDVPATASAVEHAADAIGQGTVLASPLSVASASASVATGRFAPPRLVLDPAPTGTSSSTSTSPQTGSTAAGSTAAGSTAAGSTAAGTGPSLPSGPVTALRSLMREVVLTGTGTALRTVPGAPVQGKTGTAEFGTGNPPATHAWFTGYQGDIAFAVVVEGGGFGAKAAAPLAAAFLTSLNS